ncbi:peptidylprolyl isomerase [Deinococcus sp. KNUC1210]|uniref:peptidylprolyl isomerase n=1 Tax=Deinococcus sp. KNUC1210 TaxID=2917691 RepID=UPI001EF014CB|nr:peptidylprolyl isomerase [Deinococcus sp. KNUC1210]ULH15617.1 peptidylprolyl isomerase [Deinococcus sp. KNUC1210]
MRPLALLAALSLGLAACAPAQTTTKQVVIPATGATKPVVVTPAQMTFAPAAVTPAPAPAQTWTALPFLADKPAASYPKPDNVIDPAKRYRAVMTTSKGVVTIELNAVVAPLAVNSFVFLALNHFYDNLTFHRVIAGFVAQGGDPTGTGAGGPGYQFTTETSPFAKFDSAGVLGMARSASRDSNGSQFFITLAPADSLSGSYTVFGKVVSGQDVVNALTKTENGSAKPDTIQSVSIQVLGTAK